MAQNYLRIKAFFVLEELDALGNEYRSSFKIKTLRLLDTDKTPQPCLSSTPADQTLPVLPKVIRKPKGLLTTLRRSGRFGIGY